MYSLTSTLRNIGETEKVYIKWSWSDIKFNLMNQIFHFLNFQEFINKLWKLCFPIWINGILGWLDGYSVHNTDFLALAKVLLAYTWTWLGKCSSSSFYSACGDRGLKKSESFFKISAMYILYLTKMNERGRSFLKGPRKGDTGWDYPK